MGHRSLLSRYGPLVLVLMNLGPETVRGAECFSDPELTTAVLAAIRSDGYPGGVTIYRDDRRELPLPVARASDFLFFEAVEGGREIDESSRSVLRLSSYPRVWRGFVSQKTKEVFRLYGFRSGRDYSRLVATLKIKISPRMATLIGQGFAELAYSDFARIVTSPVEAVGFALEEVGARRPDLDLGCFDQLVKALSREAFKHDYESTVSEEDGGFQVGLVVGKVGGVYPDKRTVDLRRLTIQVDQDGGSRLKGDRLLVSTDLFAGDCDLDTDEGE